MKSKKNAITVKDTSSESVTINNLIIRPVDRSRQDISDWRAAHQSAEITLHSMGVRTRLYDLYDDCCLDPVLSSLIEKRLMAITNVNIRFMKDGDDVEGLKPIIKSAEFKKGLKEILKSKLWGITLLENFFNPYRVYNVPRKHIRPIAGIIAYEQMGDSGINYREGMFLNTMVEVGEHDDLGLLVKAIPYVLYKRGCMGDWAQLVEIFGQPMKVGRYDGFDDATRIALEQAMDRAGAALSITIPKEANIEFLESKITNGSSDLHKSLINLCDEQLSILIIGQTETTKSSSSSGYAQSKTHEKTENEINKDDRAFVLSILETAVRHVFTQAGLPVEGGEWVFEDDEEELSLVDRVTIDTTLKSAGLPIDDDYLYEKYNIPKPNNYDELKKITEEKGNNTKTETPLKEKPIAKKKDVELSLNNELLQKLNDFFA